MAVLRLSGCLEKPKRERRAVGAKLIGMATAGTATTGGLLASVLLLLGNTAAGIWFLDPERECC